MSRKLRIEYENAFYHAYSRGHNKMPIFLDKHDYNSFIKICRNCYEKYVFYIHSYCLMPNHYHLFIQTPDPNLSKVMKFINQNYAQYFNDKYSKVGHVFQGRYNAILVQQDLYAKALSRYIHLNPVVANLVINPDQWLWSSFKNYKNLDQYQESFLRTSWLLEFFDNNIQLLLDFTTDQSSTLKEQKLFNQRKVILGDKNFVASVQKNHLIDQDKSSEVTGMQEIQKTYSFKEINDFVIKASIDPGEKTKALMYLLQKHTQLSLKEIGSYLGGIEAGTVGKRISRFKRQINKNKNLQNSLLLS